MQRMPNFEDEFKRRILNEAEDEGEDLSSIQDMTPRELRRLSERIADRLGAPFDAVFSSLSGLAGNPTTEPDDDDDDDEEEENDEDDDEE